MGHQILQLLGWGRRIGEQAGELFALLLIKDEIDPIERIVAWTRFCLFLFHIDLQLFSLTKLPQSPPFVLPMFCMRFGMSELRRKALAAIDEAAKKALNAPVERQMALRFALAFLANFAEERWPFDNFWRAIATQDPKVRSATVTAARNAIHRAVKG